MVAVTFKLPDGSASQHDIPAGHSVMEGAIREGVPGIDAECGGACACGTCHVLVAAEWVDRLPAPNAQERDMLEFSVDVNEFSRLSCQIVVDSSTEGLVVSIPATQR